MPQYPGAEPDVTWGRSTVRTACPLDCPDSCTLDVTVENGRVVKIDGGDANPATRGLHLRQGPPLRRRVYGEDRLLYPAMRKGPKGQGMFTRVTWDEALDLIAARMIEIRDTTRRRGDPAVLLRRLERPADAGHERRGALPRLRRRRAWRARSAPRPTGAANLGALRQDAGVTYDDYVHARLIVLWGVNPVGVRHPPRAVSSRKPAGRGAKLVVVDPRATSLARQADLHLAPQARAPICRSRWRCIDTCSRTATPTRRSSPSTRAAPTSLRARAAEWTIERAARRRRHRRRRARPASPSSTPRRRPGADPLRLGPRAQPQRRQRGGRGPRAAGGRRQVRRARRRLLDEQLRGARASRPRRG